MAISEVLPSLLKTVITSLVSVLPTLIPQLVTAITQLIVLILENINDIIMPIIDALPLIVESVMSALLSNMPIIISALIIAAMEIVKALPRILGSLLKAYLKYWVTIWESIKSVFSNVDGWFGEKFGDAWENVKKKFSRVKEFFSGVWQKIKDVFSKVGTSIGSAVSGAVKGAVNKVLSNATRVINGFIRGINVALSVINAIPGVSIKKINQLSVPRLAKGAVIPGGREFLAVLGDQPRGQTNIEAPLDTIVDAMKVALKGSGGFNGKIEVPVYIGNRQVALAVRDGESELGRQTVFGGFANAY
jgi:phage-related protein